MESECVENGIDTGIYVIILKKKKKKKYQLIRIYCFVGHKTSDINGQWLDKSFH